MATNIDSNLDYLDVNSTAYQNFFSPIKETFEGNDTVVKAVTIFAKFSGTMKDGRPNIIKCVHRDGIPEFFWFPKTDLEIFTFFKNEIHQPADPEEEDEKDLTPEQLLNSRDPEGLRHLPIDSPQVQEMITAYRQEIGQTAVERIQNIFREIAEEDLKETIEEFSQVTLDRLKIEVVYLDKKDLSKELTRTFQASIPSR